MMSAHKVLVVTAGLPEKHSYIASAFAQETNATLIPGLSRPYSIIDRLLLKLDLGEFTYNIRKLNKEVLARAHDYDILFIVKGNLITKRTLLRLKSSVSCPVIVGWTCDDMYLKHNNSSIFKRAARFYDHYFTAKILNIKNDEFSSFGIKNVYFLP